MKSFLLFPEICFLQVALANLSERDLKKERQKNNLLAFRLSERVPRACHGVSDLPSRVLMMMSIAKTFLF